MRRETFTFSLRDHRGEIGDPSNITGKKCVLPTLETSCKELTVIQIKRRGKTVN